MQLYYWKNREFREFGPDLTVSDVPRAVGWCRETLCLGFKGEYSLLKVTFSLSLPLNIEHESIALLFLQLDGEQRDLFPTGKQAEPLVSSMSEDRFVLGRDDQTILIDIDGNPCTKHTLTWSERPFLIGIYFRL